MRYLQKCGVCMEFRHWRSWCNRSSLLRFITKIRDENHFTFDASYSSFSRSFVSTFALVFKSNTTYICYIENRFWIILPKPSKDHKAAALEIQQKVNEDELKNPKASLLKKIKLVPGLMKYMVPLGLVYLFEYFINQGTVRLT